MLRKATIFVVWAVAQALACESQTRDERARQLVVDVCTTCHDFARVKAQQLNKEQWTGLIKGMLSEGAPVTDEEMDLITTYLAKHYGPPNE
jgi:hypothetical protein